MGEVVAIVESVVAQLADEAIALRRAVRDAEIDAEDHEKRAATSREAAQMRRRELGLLLVRARQQWPASGPRAKGWSEFLAHIEMDDSTAWRYMDIAGYRRSPSPDLSAPSAPPSVSSHGERKPAEPSDEIAVDRDTWCTPKWITDALGKFDLDPCANERSHVQAMQTFRLDRGQDGLALASTVFEKKLVFINPPYSDVLPWILAYKHTRFCFLLKFDPSTKWFAELFAATERVLFPRGTRIEFEPPPGVPKNKAGANQFPHALFFARAGDAPDALVEQCFDWITTKTT